MKARILMRLEGLATLAVKPQGKYQSICLYLFNTLEVKCHDHIWYEWEHYSGDSQYPVPYDSEELEGRSESFKAYAGFYDAPLWSGEYGNMRRRLCRYISDGLKSGYLIVSNDEICLAVARPEEDC